MSGSSTSAIEALILNKNVIIFIDKADINLSPLSEVKNITSVIIESNITKRESRANIDKDSIDVLKTDFNGKKL